MQLMEQKIAEEIGRKLSVFDFGRLQELTTLFDVLEREEISLEEVREFVKFMLDFRRKQEEFMSKLNKDRVELWAKNTIPCPTCSKPLMCRPITVPKGKRNKKGYTCHWFCQGEDCDFEDYTHEDFKKVYQRIMGEGR